ncbi:unnamed protein product [Oppiella nova]|uniref:F-box domain-containing protein n=1 Tax=Oppiella nova TaxID=334625 RepID=A0A7R9QPE1_9ACAR|nr:unnamed protein product [Oppiella nova]CAG2169460.1 unnamed protein product [Oppiella nova]
MYGKDNIDRFGDDLCGLLLSYFSFEDRFRCECLSKRWQRLALESQKDLTTDFSYITIFRKNPTIFESILKKCANIETIGGNVLTIITQPMLELVIKYCHRLNAMDMKIPIYVTISADTIDKFFAKFAKQLIRFKYWSYEPSLPGNSEISATIEKNILDCHELREVFNCYKHQFPRLLLDWTGQGVDYKQSTLDRLEKCPNIRTIIGVPTVPRLF